MTDSTRRAGPDNRWSILRSTALAAEHGDVHHLHFYETTAVDEDGDVVMTDLEGF